MDNLNPRTCEALSLKLFITLLSVTNLVALTQVLVTFYTTLANFFKKKKNHLATNLVTFWVDIRGCAILDTAVQRHHSCCYRLDSPPVYKAEVSFTYRSWCSHWVIMIIMGKIILQFSKLFSNYSSFPKDQPVIIFVSEGPISERPITDHYCLSHSETFLFFVISCSLQVSHKIHSVHNCVLPVFDFSSYKAGCVVPMRALIHS